MVNKKNTFNWTYFVFLASALVLLTLSIFSYQRFEQQKIASAWVSHTYLAKLKLEEVFGLLTDAESGQRGYLLTSDTVFIQSFLTSKAEIPKIILQLDSLVTDNPEQTQNLKELARLLKLRINWLTTVIDTLHDVKANQLDSFLFKGKLITDSARTQIVMMEKKEDHLLSLRIKEKQTEEKLASAFILIFSLFSLAVLVYSFFRLKKESKLLGISEYNAELLEEKINERTIEVKKINQRLTEQNLQLERKNTELASFTFMASHDLKEPLRKIEIFAEKIMRNEQQQFSENGKGYFERIIVSAQRMQNLIDSVSQYAQTNAIAPDFKPVDLNQTVAQAIETLNESIKEKSAVIEYSNLPTIKANPEQMNQLFTNLIGNAIKYSQEGTIPHIKINSGKTEAGNNGNLLAADAWKIEFSDNGIGFDEKYLDKIFQMFQRLHSKETYSGTGIGLAICKKIIENHNGTITATSTPGAGSVFSIFLPQTIISESQ